MGETMVITTADELYEMQGQVASWQVGYDDADLELFLLRQQVQRATESLRTSAARLRGELDAPAPLPRRAISLGGVL